MLGVAEPCPWIPVSRAKKYRCLLFYSGYPAAATQHCSSLSWLTPVIHTDSLCKHCSLSHEHGCILSTWNGKCSGPEFYKASLPGAVCSRFSSKSSSLPEPQASFQLNPWENCC